MDSDPVVTREWTCKEGRSFSRGSGEQSTETEERQNNDKEEKKTTQTKKEIEEKNNSTYENRMNAKKRGGV